MPVTPAATALEPRRPEDAVFLEHDRLLLELWPSVGGSVAAFSWQHAGRRIELMRGATPDAFAQRDGRDLASFPLFPFSNRVKDGRFSFRGRPVELLRPAGARARALGRQPVLAARMVRASARGRVVAERGEDRLEIPSAKVGFRRADRAYRCKEISSMISAIALPGTRLSSA